VRAPRTRACPSPEIALPQPSYTDANRPLLANGDPFRKRLFLLRNRCRNRTDLQPDLAAQGLPSVAARRGSCRARSPLGWARPINGPMARTGAPLSTRTAQRGDEFAECDRVASCRLRSGGGAFTALRVLSYLAPDVPTRGGAPAEKEKMGRLWSSSPRPANARAKPNPAFVKSKAISALCVS